MQADIDSTPEHTHVKRCSKCSEQKPATRQFFKWDSRRGIQSVCKACDALQKRGADTPPRKFHVLGELVCCTKCGSSYLFTPENFKSDKKARSGCTQPCKHCANAKSTSWRIKHPQRTKELLLIWRAAHPERVKEIKKRSHANRKSTARAAHQRRRALKRGANGNYTAKDIQLLKKAQKSKCYYCGHKLQEFHVDHVIPLSRGGTNDPSNLVLACPACNLSKNNKLPHEWVKGGRLL